LGKAQNEDSTDSSARRKLPTKLYGGTERLVSYLTEELVRLGHDVTLFACGDSITASNLVPCANTALRLDPNVRDMTPYYVMMLDEVYSRLDDFDVLHFHIDHLHYPMMRAFSDRMLTTLHGRLDLPDLTPFYSRFPELPLVSISEAQRLMGFVVGSIAEAVAALSHIDTLDRRSVRLQFERRFTVERMTQDYLEAYRHLPRISRPVERRLALVSA
jgi:Glycosyltransferase Family 4